MEKCERKQIFKDQKLKKKQPENEETILNIKKEKSWDLREKTDLKGNIPFFLFCFWTLKRWFIYCLSETTVAFLLNIFRF